MSDAQRALEGVARVAQRLARIDESGAFLEELLRGIDEELGVAHAMILVLEDDGARLVTLTSRGFPTVGVGSEVVVGEGIIGTVAKTRATVRNNMLGWELSYSRAVREQMLRAGAGDKIAREVPLPGLLDAKSVCAVPLVAGDALVGVLSAESDRPRAFSHAVEQALTTLAPLAAHKLRAVYEDAAAEPVLPAAPAAGTPIVLTYFQSDDSVFVGHEYVIKSLPGRILWKLVSTFASTGRAEFTNKELRVDPKLKLPTFKDNLESRLILLRRRLEEKACGLSIEPSGRGRFRLVVTRPLVLESSP